MVASLPRLSPHKFRDPTITAKGEPRARVALERLETLWVNTGTLCNIECASCYIESSPHNDRFAYVTCAELEPFFDEAVELGTREIGFTGGEPFMNPDILASMSAALERGFEVLVLTNAMQPMRRARIEQGLLRLLERWGDRITVRVSVDHFTAARHEEERGAGSWEPTLAGLRWLASCGFRVHVAGRTRWGNDQAALRRGYAELFAREDLPIDATRPSELVLFPEMDETADVPEITTACWGILGKSPTDVMCAHSRMLVKRQGEASLTVLACTLVPYDPRFDLGPTLAGASRDVALNHPHCAKFCVLGGGSCSG